MKNIDVVEIADIATAIIAVQKNGFELVGIMQKLGHHF